MFPRRPATKLKVTLVLTWTLLLLSTPTSSALGVAKSLKVGLLLGSPYVFWEASRLKGIDFDVCQLVARELDMQFEPYVLPFSALDSEVLQKLGLDLVIGGIHMTEERKKTFSFSVPYVSSGLAIVLREGLNWDGNVERVTFAVKKGATGERIVREWVQAGRKVKYETFVSNEEILVNLLLKRLDAAFFDHINALFFAKSYGLQVWKELVYRTDIGIVILNQDLSAQLNEVLRKRATDIRNIVKSYTGIDVK